ncbi:hypothetical protein GA0115240_137834 [Streptomyces sp. DvalAA-14]|nr:hypothetical protein GA0115240_137834 [Streptomyces sp. DvalAA-14]
MSGDKIITTIVVSAYSGDKYYHHFSLTLPQGSRISRSDKESIGSLAIRGPLVDIDFAVVCDGFGAGVPFNFLQEYMNLDPFKASAMEVKVFVKVSVKRRFSVLLQGSTNYYGWVEPFMARLRKDFDFDAFLERINWDNISATLHSMRNFYPYPDIHTVEAKKAVRGTSDEEDR